MTNVLLVEDDPDISDLLATVLGRHGFKVSLARTVSDASAQIESDTTFDLAVIDFWLGSQNAISLLDQLATQNPIVPAILMSGGRQELSLESTAAIGEISGVRMFLQKPFKNDALIMKIKELLAENLSSNS